ncbi:MAG: cupin domain-containing protein [Planctomyces sp.]|jgi:uncharacterized cupin superfamily protein|nr:cupin domain-containing protein [Planctomyces sp.]
MREVTRKHVWEGRTISVVGDVYRFLATGQETGGAYTQWEATIPPGGGPPPHIHTREEEGFFIIEGEITLRIGDETVVAGPGMFANIPRGVAHSFSNESEEPARMLITVAPSGLEEMFYEVGHTLEEGSTIPIPATMADIEKLIAIAPQYGIEILHPPHE